MVGGSTHLQTSLSQFTVKVHFSCFWSWNSEPFLFFLLSLTGITAENQLTFQMPSTTAPKNRWASQWRGTLSFRPQFFLGDKTYGCTSRWLSWPWGLARKVRRQHQPTLLWSLLELLAVSYMRDGCCDKLLWPWHQWKQPLRMEWKKEESPNRKWGLGIKEEVTPKPPDLWETTLVPLHLDRDVNEETTSELSCALSFFSFQVVMRKIWKDRASKSMKLGCWAKETPDLQSSSSARVKAHWEIELFPLNVSGASQLKDNTVGIS